jgi:CBS domain-containing protein
MICPFCQHENIEGADNCVNCGQALYGLDLPEQGGKYGQPPAFILAPLSNLPRRTPPTVGASDPVGLVVRLMQTSNANCALVMDGERLAGILTSWDILHKVAGPREDLNAVTCRQIMTENPITLEWDDSLALALNVMANGGFRHVPIVEDGKPVSFIDINDLFRHISPRLL